MKYDAVGSYLPPMELVEARQQFRAGQIDAAALHLCEDQAVKDIVERQIAAGLGSVTSGEVRRRSWDKDFYSGLAGVEIERIESGSIYQDVDTFTDIMRFPSRIAYNPEHPFFESFTFIWDYVGQRAQCRQTLPSPTDLYYDMLQMGEGDISRVYPSPETVIDDIASAFRQTALRFYELGCRDLLFDDTVIAQLCDATFTSRLILGGVDIMAFSDDLVRLLNESVAGLPADMKVSLYTSGGTTVVPEWASVFEGNNPLTSILPRLRFARFFMPFNPGDTEALRVLTLLPEMSRIVLGLVSAHSPYPDDINDIMTSVETASALVGAHRLAVGPQCGFKMTHFLMRGLVYEDQWKKLASLARIAGEI